MSPQPWNRFDLILFCLFSIQGSVLVLLPFCPSPPCGSTYFVSAQLNLKLAYYTAQWQVLPPQYANQACMDWFLNIIFPGCVTPTFESVTGKLQKPDGDCLCRS